MHIGHGIGPGSTHGLRLCCSARAAWARAAVWNCFARAVKHRVMRAVTALSAHAVSFEFMTQMVFFLTHLNESCRVIKNARG